MSRLVEAAAALRATGGEIPKALNAGVAEATALMEAAVKVGQADAGAGSGRLRGVGKDGAAIGVQGSVLHGTGLVRATGPAWLLDHPTVAHVVQPRTAGAMTIAGLAHPVSRPIERPATAGKFYFEAAVDLVAPKVESIVERNVAAGLLKFLG